jgi:hypothetical protein
MSNNNEGRQKNAARTRGGAEEETRRGQDSLATSTAQYPDLRPAVTSVLLTLREIELMRAGSQAEADGLFRALLRDVEDLVRVVGYRGAMVRKVWRWRQ